MAVETVTWVDRVRTKAAIKNELGRAALAEFFGTLVLVLVITSVCAQNIIPKFNGNALIGVNFGVACGIAFGIAISARTSGGHINPAVTLAFLVLGSIKPARALIYWVAQFAGAFFGALLTYLLYNDAINVFDGGIRKVEGVKTATAHIFASYPASHLGIWNGLFDQILGTAIFVLIVVHTVDRRNHYPAWVQPFIMGLGFLMIGTAFAYNAGYPLNPARDLAPRFFTLIIGYGWKTFSFNDYSWFWIPVVGPLLGGVLGAVIYHAFLGWHYVVDEYTVVHTGEIPVHTHHVTEKVVVEEGVPLNA